MKFSIIPFKKDIIPFDKNEEVVVIDPFTVFTKELLAAMESNKFGDPENGFIINAINNDGKAFSGVVFKVSDIWTNNYINVKISETYHEKVAISLDYVGIFDSNIPIDKSNVFIGYISNDADLKESNYTSTEFSIITNIETEDEWLEESTLIDEEAADDFGDSTENWEDSVEDTTDYKSNKFDDDNLDDDF